MPDDCAEIPIGAGMRCAEALEASRNTQINEQHPANNRCISSPRPGADEVS
jgi:hypothetical protein